MPDPKSTLAAILALAGLGVAACDTPPAPIHTIHTDSAGIAIATAVEPLWGPGDGWTVTDEPVVEIGTLDGAPEYQFADVVAAVRLGNGDIVVADGGAFELRSYDAMGTFQWRAGRFGEGPGEFESLDFLGTTAGDSLVAYDSSLLRAQVFGPLGELARTLRVEITEGDAAGQAAVADKAVGVVDGLLIARFVDYADFDEMPTGIVRWPLERLGAVDLADGTGWTLMVTPGHEANVRVREGGRWSIGRYVFFRGPESAAAGGRVAAVDTEAWTVRMLSPRDGAATALVRRDVTPPAASASLFDLHLDGLVEIAFPDPDRMPPAAVQEFRQMWSSFPRSPQLPVLRSVHLDAAGNLWLQPYYVAGADPSPYEIHAPDGTWLGSVALPPGLQRAFVQYQAPYMEIGEDYVLGVWTDELDVQYVRMYRINK